MMILLGFLFRLVIVAGTAIKAIPERKPMVGKCAGLHVFRMTAQGVNGGGHPAVRVGVDPRGRAWAAPTRERTR